MTTTLNKLIQAKEKEFDDLFDHWVYLSGIRTGCNWNHFRNGIKSVYSNFIQSGYELAIKDVEKIIGKNEEYSQSGYFKEDNGEIITNDEIQGMNILKNELRLKLQSLLKESK